MPENNIDKLNLPELWTFIVVILSGGIGGCSAAFTNRSNEKHLVTILTLLGYMFAGVFGSLIMFTMLSSIGEGFSGKLDTIILWSCLTGFSTAIALAGTNLGFKIVLKKLGIEFEINVRRIPKKSNKTSKSKPKDDDTYKD